MNINMFQNAPLKVAGTKCYFKLILRQFLLISHYSVNIYKCVFYPLVGKWDGINSHVSLKINEVLTGFGEKTVEEMDLWIEVIGKRTTWYSRNWELPCKTCVAKQPKWFVVYHIHTSPTMLKKSQHVLLPIADSSPLLQVWVGF